MAIEPFRVVKLVADVLEERGIVYWIGGSVASMKYGEFRTTQDVDFVVDLTEADVVPLVEAWQAEFYVDDEMMRDAIQTLSSFNIIHLETAFKADFFITRGDAWTEAEGERRRLVELIPGDSESRVYIASPEDMILQKLRWFRMGGGVSDRQWRDVQMMLKVQRASLEIDYLRYWSRELGLVELLDAAMRAAGIVDSYGEKSD